VKEHLETPDHVVIRLMETAVRREANTTQDLIIVSGTSQPSWDVSGHFASDPRIGQSQTTGWRDTLAQWSRWVLPSSRVSGHDLVPSKERTMSGPARQGCGQLSVRQGRILPTILRSPLEASDDPPPGWQRPKVATTATFGHVLHTTRSTDLLPAPPALLSRDYPHVISPVVPPPSVFSSWGLSLSSVPVQTSIILRFRVSPTHAAAITTASVVFPTMELVINVADGQTGAAKIEWNNCDKRLFATVSTHHVDVMMPAEQVDVRLTQTAQLECNPSMLSSPTMEKLGLFVDISDLNLQQGRMVTPSEVVIPIPPSLIVPCPSNPRPNKSPVIWAPSTAEEGAAADQQVTYTFSGLELRQSIATKCAGHMLQYSSIEAGHHGGRRADLSLHALHPPATAEPLPPTELARLYLEAVQSIARGEHFSWFQTVSG